MYPLVSVTPLIHTYTHTSQIQSFSDTTITEYINKYKIISETCELFYFYSKHLKFFSES